MGHKIIIRKISVVFVVVAFGLQLAAHFLPVIHGKEKLTSANVEYTFWRVCVNSVCDWVKNSSTGCTELSSRLHTMAAMALIHCGTDLILIGALIAEVVEVTLPIKNMTYYALAAAGASAMIVWPLAVGTLLATLCGDLTTIKEKGGDLGIAFYLSAGSFLAVLLIAPVYVLGMLKRERDDDDFGPLPEPRYRQEKGRQSTVESAQQRPAQAVEDHEPSLRRLGSQSPEVEQLLLSKDQQDLL